MTTIGMTLPDILTLLNSPADLANLTESDAQEILTALARMTYDTATRLVLDLLAEMPIEIACDWHERVALLDGNPAAAAAALLASFATPLALSIESDNAVRVDCDGEGTCSLAEFIDANACGLDAADLARFRALSVGESVRIGGGACADYTLRRLA